MNLNQWYDEALTPDEYIESMEKHKTDVLYIYDNFAVPEDKKFFQRLAKENLRVIVLTEDWCGDAMLNIPILFRLTEQANIPVKLLLRDQNLQLMDQYLTNGKSRSIPIFIFIDENGNEVAKWGPRAEAIQQFVDESRSNLPAKDSSDFEEKSKEMYLFMMKSFRDNTDFWEDVYNSLKNVLEKA